MSLDTLAALASSDLRRPVGFAFALGSGLMAMVLLLQEAWPWATLFSTLAAAAAYVAFWRPA